MTPPRGPRAVLALAGVVLLAVAVAQLAPVAPGPAAPPAPAPAPELVVRLSAAGGPRTARVVAGDEALGTIEVTASGGVSGDAMLRIANAPRELALRRLRIEADPALAPEVALAVQRLYGLRGVLQVTIAAPGSASH